MTTVEGREVVETKRGGACLEKPNNVNESETDEETKGKVEVCSTVQPAGTRRCSH